MDDVEFRLLCNLRSKVDNPKVASLPNDLKNRFRNMSEKELLDFIDKGHEEFERSIVEMREERERAIAEMEEMEENIKMLKFLI